MNLFKKYNTPGPRYTSYPTVPYWEKTPTEAEWISGILQSMQAAHKKGVGAAVYIHIPFCQSLCTYCGCNTRITRNKEVSTPYIATLLKEFKIYSEKLGRKILVSEIHLGGGTPTFLSPEELDHLMSEILSQSECSRLASFSIEADPRVTTKEHLKTLARLGFRRLSLGIQDFDPHVQEIVHRTQSENEVRIITETAREQGFTSINYDLIYGLPFQNNQSITQTIEAVTRLRPDRIAFYSYAHVPWIKPSQRRFSEADLPTGDIKRALYELGRSLLEKAHYFEIGMDHFSLQSDALWTSYTEGTLHRNFMGYTTSRVEPLIGLGVSAIGDCGNIFAQNEKLLEAYQARVEKGELPLFRGHILNAEDQILRQHILNLMTRFETSWENPDLYTHYLEKISSHLSELSGDALVTLKEKSCHITDSGRPFLRNICMAFDARLNDSRLNAARLNATPLFSKTL